MNFIRIDKNNQVNGAGLRCVIWVAGCEHHCKNCHNPETWNYNAGHEGLTNEEITLIYEQLSSPEISGVTFTGGDPLAPQNRETVTKLCHLFKETFPTKTIWMYTGYLFEEVAPYLKNVDVLIDGKYDETKNPGIGKLKWRGSSNQRVIDVQGSLSCGEIVEYRDFNGKTISENEGSK